MNHATTRSIASIPNPFDKILDAPWVDDSRIDLMLSQLVDEQRFITTGSFNGHFPQH